MKAISLFAVAALAAGVGVANADEPMVLSAKNMDGVTAGNFLPPNPFDVTITNTLDATKTTSTNETITKATNWSGTSQPTAAPIGATAAFDGKVVASGGAGSGTNVVYEAYAQQTPSQTVTYYTPWPVSVTTPASYQSGTSVSGLAVAK